MSQLQDAENLRVVINQRYEDGQFSSLQAGIRALDFAVGGTLVCLIDQPHLRQTTYGVIIKNALVLPKKIILPEYESRGGHPVYLPQWIFPEIAAQPSTITLRDLFLRFPDEIVRVDVKDPGIREDIDTMEDLNRLEGLISEKL